MEDRNRIITYKSKEIFYHDHSRLCGKNLFNNLKDAFKLIDEKNNGKEILTMSNWMNAIMSPEAMDCLKSDDCVRINKMVKKGAVVGVTGIKKIFLSVYNKLTGDKTRLFNTEEEAKEWLVKD